MKEQLQQLEQDGYTIFPAFLDTQMTARIRTHMNSLLPSPAPRQDEKAKRLYDLRHPIPGAIMADILDNPHLLEIAHATIEPRRKEDLRMLEQVLIRTDPCDAAPGSTGWHIDKAFLPQHSNSRPRQTFYHMVHALNAIRPGGAATLIVPGSHHKTYAAAEKLGTMESLDALKRDPIGIAGIDLDEAIEVEVDEGDLVVFNPMCLHSASVNVSDAPRYVYFASFIDISARDLQSHLQAENYQRDFWFELHENLPPHSRHLLAPLPSKVP